MKSCMSKEMESADLGLDSWGSLLFDMTPNYKQNYERWPKLKSHILELLLPKSMWNGQFKHMFIQRSWDMEDRFPPPHHAAMKEAIHLDGQYAIMVHGASVKTSLVPDIWCADVSLPLSDVTRESERFFKASFFLLSRIPTASFSDTQKCHATRKCGQRWERCPESGM